MARPKCDASLVLGGHCGDHCVSYYIFTDPNKVLNWYTEMTTRVLGISIGIEKHTSRGMT